MSEINKEMLYEQLKTSEPKFADTISLYLTIQGVKENLLRFNGWLESKGATLIYADFEGQSPFWEVKYNDKACYLVLNGLDNICIMLKVSFTDEAQVVMRKNNLHDVILNNLQDCSRKDGGHCNNCHLPSDVAGVDEIIFGKEVKNLCCGQFISFDNPNSGTIEGIKKLLEL
jgi:hypothetical protein